MTTGNSERPPYFLALLAFALVLLGYVVSLAPTVTFWDAGEFISASRILGIPHPPGTPLFVLLGHMWGKIMPFSEYAYRTNLMSATFSALAAGFFFLVIHEVLGRATSDLPAGRARFLRVGGALAGAVCGAFVFTNWQNSNETEVYAVGTFMSASICWLAMVWRRQRGLDRAPRTLWLMLYIAGLSIGNHLLTLLVGPGVILFMMATLRQDPAADPVRRAREWAETWVVAATWVLTIGMGLGSTMLTALGGICFVAAAIFAGMAKVARFAVMALAVASIGITSYGYLYFRSQHHPMINEAQPDNFRSLLAVIRREQYPPRTPLDDPTVQSGAGNPGRSPALIVEQFANYFQYFDWQWANGIRGTLGGKLPIRSLFTVFVFFALGLQGMLLQRRLDRASWWLLFGVFMVTGIGLVIYMNFKPGYSLAYTFEKWPQPSDHEVRDRDYFFVVSFIIWGHWVGMGLWAWARRALDRLRSPLPAAAVLAVGALPFFLNFGAARRNNPIDGRLAADVAYDMLNSVPPYSVIFTYGDNDTFPLWWAQEVGGIRRDVTVVCLALAQTDWYVKQLRDMAVRPFDEASAPSFWKGKAGTLPTWPLLRMTDQEIEQVTSTATVLPQPRAVPVGAGFYTLPANRYLNPNEIVTALILRDNVGRRPVYWSITTGRNFKGLDPLIVQQGLAYRVSPTVPDTTGLDTRRLYGALLDVATTDSLAWHTFRYAGLLEATEEEIANLEPTASGMAYNLGLPFTQLALAYQGLGDREHMLANLERAAKLVPDPNIKVALDQMRLAPFLGTDSTNPDSSGPRTEVPNGNP
ncbi:MAG: DUF2723 domain-containing protein [Gemmatimonadota bacterium]